MAQPMRQRWTRSLVMLAVVALVVGGLAPAKAGASGHKIYWGTWTDGYGVNDLSRANLDGSGVETLVTLGFTENVSSLALHVGGGKMYWNEYDPALIRRANLDGSGVEDLITDEFFFGMAVDANHGKLYWASRAHKVIRRANLDGSGVENLVLIPGGAFPGPLALDLKHGKIYWGWGGSGWGKISRANLDGSGVQILIISPPGTPGALALDVVAGKMYWTALGDPLLHRANLDGSGVEDLFSPPGIPGALALDAGSGKIYFPSVFHIWRANLDGSGLEVLVTDVASVAIALNLFAGGEMYGFYYNKAVCKPPNTRPKQRFSIKGGRSSQAFDCAAGLAIGPGDDLTITLTGVALSSSIGGSLVGFQPTKVICYNLTTGQRLKIVIPPGTQSFDCAARSFMVNPGDNLKVTISGFEPRE